MLALLFAAQKSLASEPFARYGVGVANSAEQSWSETKVLMLGVRDEVFGPIYREGNLGFWIDRAGAGRKSSLFGSYGYGFAVLPGPLDIRSSWSIAAISRTDSYLGGHLQFANQTSAGLRDAFGAAISVNYTHISSAGIYPVNKGRDFLTLQIGWDL